MDTECIHHENISLDHKSAGSLARVALQFRPEWSESETRVEVLSGGITNRLYRCYNDNNKNSEQAAAVLIRIYGIGSELYLNRASELVAMNSAKLHNLGPRVYAKYNNGLVYEYLAGKVIDKDMMYDDKICQKVAQAVAALHLINFKDINQVEYDKTRDTFVFSELKTLFELLKEDYKSNMKDMNDEFLKAIPTRAQIKKESEFVINYLSEMVVKNKSMLTHCHNDLLLGNIIYNEETETIKFIDWEYAGLSYPAFDICHHFNRFCHAPDYSFLPDKDYQLTWLRHYLNAFWSKLSPSELPVSDQLVHSFYNEVNKFSMASHLLWAIWALVQAQTSDLEFNFVHYASTLFDRYSKRKQLILSSHFD